MFVLFLFVVVVGVGFFVVVVLFVCLFFVCMCEMFFVGVFVDFYGSMHSNAPTRLEQRTESYIVHSYVYK